MARRYKSFAHAVEAGAIAEHALTPQDAREVEPITRARLKAKAKNAKRAADASPKTPKSAKRTRMVSFRISPDEHARVEKLMRVVNGRQRAANRPVFGIAEFMRVAVLVMMGEPMAEIVKRLENNT